MSKLRVIYIVFAVLSLNLAASSVDAGTDFDLLIFTQQWPATACKEWKKHNPSHTCSMPKITDSWTIHGIWPTKIGTIGPGFCNSSWYFDPEKIRPIEGELMQKWPNIYGGTPEYGLWTHEWSKHGTCAAVLKPLNSEFNYFRKGLDFLKMYSMTDILKENHIIPSNENKYSIKDIYNAIKSRTNKNPEIQCKKEEGRESYISEIRICFTKELEITDCDGIVAQISDYESVLTNCDTSKDVVYPHYQKYIWYVELHKLLTWVQWFTL